MGIHEGERVYADTVGESGLAVGVPYTVDDVDVIGCSFRLLSEVGEPIAPATVGFRLLTLVTGRELYATQATAGDFRLKTHRDGEILVLTDYDGEVPLLPQANICRHRAIRAAWYTPVFDLGYPAREKSLHRLTLTSEPGIVGQMTFGFDTRCERHMHDVKGSGGAFSFESLDYRDFTFTTGFAHSFTKRIFARGFNYIQFRFVSESDTDGSINRFEAEYSILSQKGGIR
jgi:hypothetical protein